MNDTRHSHDGSGALKVLAAGVFATGSGYPNAAVTLKIMRDRLRMEVVECGTGLGGGAPLWQRATAGHLKRLGFVLRLLLGNLSSLMRVLGQYRKGKSVVYVRYPATIFMFLVSMIPGPWRPRCYVDGFISIWESMFLDRGYGGPGHWAAVLVKAVERRGFRAAYRVLVDTEKNRAFYCAQFSLDSSQVLALPLAVDQEAWRRSTRRDSPRGKCRVLFVGTFVPLHGMERIVDALHRLQDLADIEFVFIGDGQEAGLLEAALSKWPTLPVTWQRGWLSAEAIAQEVLDSDICLGIFGGEGKAARVLPYKLYLYLCAGKAMITQAELSVPTGLQPPPAEYVPAPSGATIAQSIRRLAADKDRRAALEVAAREYFDRYLSNEVVARHWRAMLDAG